VERFGSVTLLQLGILPKERPVASSSGLDISGFTDIGRAALVRSHLNATGSDMFY
jgi:hypothetical protein